MKVKDGYSSRANPRRGYHDYVRVVTFEGANEYRQKALIEEMVRGMTPQNMWCSAKQSGPNEWTISYGYDSGD